MTPTSLNAVEILDSRGRPTVLVRMRTEPGTIVQAGVPSGASTGSGEAVELRDGDDRRFDGKGVLTAVSHVNGEIAEEIQGRSFADLSELDAALIDLDGTADKSRLGANALVGISMAAARAFAVARDTPLWAQMGVVDADPRLPVPHFNVVNGGAHAANPLDFQEFMLAPIGAPSYAEALRAGAEVYARLRRRLGDAGHSTGLGDEGGFAPDLAHPDDVLELIVSAIEDAGYKVGTGGIAIALDPAANGFRRDGLYTVAGEKWSTQELVTYYEQMVGRFPVWSIEDGVAEDDDEGWRLITDRLGGRIQIVGDDNFVTNPRIIEQAITDGVANAALIKVNQIGTVSETLEAMALCRRHGYAAMVSHRSGETPDTFIADLAVGSGCGQLKSGAPARGERTAKYNRLLEISSDNPDLEFGLA
ncbi:MAG: phosphopyruvate hydratase [Nocardioides sp.]